MKRKVTKNRKYVNTFDYGGLTQLAIDKGSFSPAQALRPSNLNLKVGDLKTPLNFKQKLGVFGSKAGGALGAIGAATNIIGAGMNNAQIGNTSKYDSALAEAESFQSTANDNDTLLNEWSDYQPLEHISWKDVKGMSGGQRAMNTVGAAGSGAMAGMTVGGPIGGIIGGAAGLFSGIFGSIKARRRAKRYAKRYNRNVDAINERNLVSLENTADNIDTQNDLSMAEDYFAYGGPIHIKEKNKGAFTDYCGGEVTTACINRGKNSPNPLTRKRATFAANARNWNALGGPLFTNGANWDNGLIIIGNGDTHENNPYEGVQIGVDQQGIPNLVEEGEVIWNDYVFSNRLKPSKEVKNKYKLKGNTFADAVKYLQEESEERPNDPISKRSLDSMLVKIANEQEVIRQNKEGQEGVNYAACGGKINKFDDGSWLYREFKPGDVPTEENVLESIGDYEFKPTIGLHDAAVKAARDLSMSPNSKYFRGFVSDKRDKFADIARKSPILGSMIGLGMSLKGPDYSNANRLVEATKGLKDVSFSPISNFIQYIPKDTLFDTNKAQANAAATRSALKDRISPSTAANLLALDYNTQGALGDIKRKAELDNLAQKMRVEEFNRRTNMFNTEGQFRADATNMRNAELRMQALQQAAALREEIKQGRRQSILSNIDNLFNNIGAIGTENYNRDIIDNLQSLLYSTKGKYKGNKTSKGGYLTIKRK